VSAAREGLDDTVIEEAVPMSDRTSRRARRVAAASAALLAAATLTGSAAGSAESGPFHQDEPFTDTWTDFPCFEGLAGAVSGREVVDGHFTENGPPSLSFHAHGKTTQSYRIDFADGRFVLGTFTGRFSFNATGRAHVVDSGGGRDRATVYAADGRLIGPLEARSVAHVTYVDANDNHEPDAGEFTARVDRVRADCP
jgi:hypothetical protein